MLRRPGPTLLLALVTAQALALLGVLAFLVPAAHERDVDALQGFMSLDREPLEPLLSPIAHLADPLPYAFAGLALILGALARGRWRLALGLPVVLVGSGLLTATLKQGLASPRVDALLGPGVHISEASWPSGHATASMTIALLLVVVVPARWRPIAAAAGGLFALAVSYSLLALAWHFPSDVLGGYLVATFSVLLLLAGLAFAERRAPEPARGPAVRDALPALGVAAAALVLAIGGAAAHPEWLEDRTAFLVLAGAIGALALALVTAFATALRPTR